VKFTHNIVHWTPRILGILAVLFISMFALDSFAPHLTVWQQISGFLLHLVPTYILAALLVVAWKWERVGGILFIVIGAVFTPVIFTLNHQRNQFSILASLGIVMMVTVPFIVIGVLFYLSDRLHKKPAALT
jgi:hypothetical protein